MKKKLSVIISWRNRDELKQTLMHNAPEFKECCSEVLVINAGGDSRRLKGLLRDVDYKVKRIDVPCPDFNKSLCLNIGAFCSSPDSNLLFFLDADILLERAALRNCLSSIAENSFIVFSRVDESEFLRRLKNGDNESFIRSKIYTSGLVCADGRAASIDLQIWDSGYTGMGLMMLPKKAFVEIDGANSKLTGWGFEDTDIQFRLQLALNLKRIVAGRAVHLTHSDKVRDLKVDMPDVDFTVRKNIGMWKNEMQAHDNYHRGDFLGTYRHDIAKWGKTLVRPLSDSGV